MFEGIKYLFSFSTTQLVGDGNGISYWFDSWQGQPISWQDTAAIQESQISLREACSRINQIDPTYQAPVQISFNSERDQISWKWGKKGEYTSKSAYGMLMMGGKIKWPFLYIWSTKGASIGQNLCISIAARKNLNKRCFKKKRNC